MTGKRKRTKWLILLVVCGVLLFACGTLILGPRVGSEQDGEESSPADDGDTGLHRGQVLEAIEHTRAAFEGNPDDAETRLQLANLLYQAGSFPEAKETLLPLLDAPEPAPQAMRLMAELDYLAGDYASAERMLNRVIESAPDDFPAQLEARTRLMHVYYQTNQYAGAADLFPDQAYQPSLAVAMQAFQGQTPYQITWHSEEHRTAVPFVVTNPLRRSVRVRRLNPMPDLIRVLIADDHRVVRQGLRGFLETYADIEVVAEAENGAQAVALAGEHVPDVILMDLLMPEMDGVEAIGRIGALVSNILSKLHLAHRTQATLYALKRRLVPLDDTPHNSSP
jgi:CheY-like chemotaxis protein